jgi:HK97 family phage prohead protease
VKSNFEIKDADSKTGIVTGYASIFGNMDSDNEIVMQGAFAKTLIERGCNSPKPRIKHLWQHDSWQPIGVPIVLKEDEKGLYFETQFGKDTFSQDKLQQHIDKIITELSIGYNVVRSEDVRDESTGERVSRKLIELKLWEYSSVTWGANSMTEVISAKGEVKDILANLNKRLEALNKGLKNGKYTDETCEQFESEIEKIKSIIQSLNINPAPGDPTQKVVAPTNKQILETILLTLKNHNDGHR